MESRQTRCVPDLRADAVHVWRVAIDGPTVDAADLRPDERARADRFRAERDRARFIASHAALRVILGAYAGARPEELAFEAGERGKPGLKHPAGTGIEFNLSHSGGWAVVAVARGRRVGVDVEQVRPLAERESIVVPLLLRRGMRRPGRPPRGAPTRGFLPRLDVQGGLHQGDRHGPRDGARQLLRRRRPPRAARGCGRSPATARPPRSGRSATSRWRAGYAGAVMAEGGGWELLCYDYDGAFSECPSSPPPGYS